MRIIVEKANKVIAQCYARVSGAVRNKQTVDNLRIYVCSLADLSTNLLFISTALNTSRYETSAFCSCLRPLFGRKRVRELAAVAVICALHQRLILSKQLLTVDYDNNNKHEWCMNGECHLSMCRISYNEEKNKMLQTVYNVLRVVKF